MQHQRWSSTRAKDLAIDAAARNAAMAVKRADTGRACERFLARLVDYLTEAGRLRRCGSTSLRRPTRASAALRARLDCSHAAHTHGLRSR